MKYKFILSNYRPKTLNLAPKLRNLNQAILLLQSHKNFENTTDYKFTIIKTKIQSLNV